MNRTGTIGLLLAGTATALLLGSGTALADEPAPTPQPHGFTLSEEQTARLCERIPQVLDNLAELETRLAADASTVGSTAYLTERVETAEAAGRTERAERLRERLDRRAGLPDRIDEIEARVVALRDAHCAS